MKKIIIYLLASIITVGMSCTTVKAYEMSGEIIREIMSNVDEEMSLLEDKTAEYDRDKAPLLEDLKKQVKAFEDQKDPLKKENGKVDILLTNAKLNQYDLKEVGAYLGTITNIVPKLRQLRVEIKGGGDFDLEEDFRDYRSKMGKFMTKAATILDKLKDTAPKYAKKDIEFLENNLVGILTKWESPLTNIETSVDQIDQTVNDLEEAFSQLIVIERLLKQENIKLRMVNYTAIANLALIRLGKGKLGEDTFLTTPIKMRRDLTERAKMMDKVLSEPTSFSVNAVNPAKQRTQNDIDAITRIKSGNYRWD